MNELDKLKLRNNCRELVANINVSDIQDYLYERRVLNEDNLDFLINEKSQSKAARRLIVSILPRKGPDAYKIFCDALVECGADYLVEKLEATQVVGYSELSSSPTSKNLFDSGSEAASADIRRQDDTIRGASVTAAAAAAENDSEVVQRLERENTELKRQLSFYEEGTTKGHRRTRSSGSRSSGQSLNLNLALKGSDSGLSEVDSEELFTDTGEPFDCADGSDIITPRFITAICDDDSEEPSSSYGDVFVPAKEDVTSLSELQEILAEDIVDYFMKPMGSRRNPQVFNKSQAAYILALRDATELMSNDHGTVFEQLSSQVDLAVTWREIHEQMKKLYDKFFEDKLQQDGPLWGKIVAIFTLTGFVAKRCQEIDKVVLPLGQFLGKYMNKKLKRKIEKMGGWDAFCSKLQKKELTFSCIFPATLLQSAVTAPKRGSSFSRTGRQSSSVSNDISTTAPPRLLQRATQKRQGSFLRTC